MTSRNYAQVAPTSATIALNAYIFGYAGHSLVTPHASLKQLWWTNERIEAKVTRAFVVSRLRGEERDFLDRPLDLGDLTDDTYMEWILRRAKRLFLILAEIGVPDQIFGCVDDSWDDSDLPIPLERVPSLELSCENDPVLNKRFYDTQFVYLLRQLTRGSHIDYGPSERIPMEPVNTVPPAVALQHYDRVHFPGRPEEVFMRRKYTPKDRETGGSCVDAFARDVAMAKVLQHRHIASAWASYTTEGAAFVLSDFVPEHTLASFIDHRVPLQLLRVAAPSRPLLVLGWMHCLSHALSSLHRRGIAHTKIRPSNIWIDREHHIAFADVGSLATFQIGKRMTRIEACEYAAPERQVVQTSTVKTKALVAAASPLRTQLSIKTILPIAAPTLPIKISTTCNTGASRKLRRLDAYSLTDISSASDYSDRSSRSSNNVGTASHNHNTDHSPTTTVTSSLWSRTVAHMPFPPSPSSTPQSPSSSSFRTLHGHDPASSPAFSKSSPAIASPHDPEHPCQPPTHAFLPFSSVDPASLLDLPTPTLQQSDVFSLGCVFLDILTFLVRGKITDFVKFRSAASSRPSSSAEPDVLAAWIDVLEAECPRLMAATPASAAVLPLLLLVRSMLAQNAALRPHASEVCDRIAQILVVDCAFPAPCCLASARIEEEEEEPPEHESELASSVSFLPPTRSRQRERFLEFPRPPALPSLPCQACSCSNHSSHHHQHHHHHKQQQQQQPKLSSRRFRSSRAHKSASSEAYTDSVSTSRVDSVTAETTSPPEPQRPPPLPPPFQHLPSSSSSSSSKNTKLSSPSSWTRRLRRATVAAVAAFTEGD